MRYGSLEYAYAEPFAIALSQDRPFRRWLLARTRFAAYADEAKLLDDEMRAARAKSAQNWWRSHFTESCRCAGCSGQETDLLAIFEEKEGRRFALHVEIKQPADRFPSHKDQAANYRLRADCWVNSPPKAVLKHSEADTLLLCAERRLGDYMPHLAKFGALLTFEEIAGQFPKATIV